MLITIHILMLLYFLFVSYPRGLAYQQNEATKSSGNLLVILAVVGSISCALYIAKAILIGV